MDDTIPHSTSDTSPPGLDIPDSDVGPKLADGRDAEVFDLGNGRVLRRYRAGNKGSDGKLKTSELEAEIMRYVAAQGYPVPAVHTVSGPDMVMDRVDGPTMLKDLGRRPWMVWRHGRLLARLHRRLHEIPAPEWIPTYASHPAFTTASVDGPLPAPPPPGASGGPETLLHLDLHPDNVMLSSRGPMVIDWRNTRRGDGAIDIASTWLIMATSQLPDSGPRRLAMDVVRRLFVYAFLHHAGRTGASRCIPVVARYRLADRNLLPSERPAIQALARSVGTSL